MNSLAIIPCYNEKVEIVQEVVDKAKKYVNEVLVIDDGSKIPVKLKNCKILRNEPNKGKGFSLIRGFDFGKKNNFDVLITLDSDGEHLPEEIPLFLEKIRDYDFVIGQRKSYRSFKRKALNYFATFWFMLLIPGIRDMYCGFRAIKVEKLKKMEIEDSDFELEPEMLLDAVKKKIKIGFVNIKTNPVEKSHLKFKNYLRTNDMYDRWILENYKYLKFGKRLILVPSAYIGLKITKLLR